MTARTYLPEVPEREAEGLVAELYGDIRQVVGLPLVNLVYRHLAVEPRRLEAAWSQLRPNLTDEAIDSGAETLLTAASLDVPALSAPTLEAVGLDRRGLDAVAATLAAYNHANPRNLIALLALTPRCVRERVAPSRETGGRGRAGSSCPWRTSAVSTRPPWRCSRR